MPKKQFDLAEFNAAVKRAFAAKREMERAQSDINDLLREKQQLIDHCLQITRNGGPGALEMIMAERNRLSAIERELKALEKTLAARSKIYRAFATVFDQVEALPAEAAGSLPRDLMTGVEALQSDISDVADLATN